MEVNRLLTSYISVKLTKECLDTCVSLLQWGFWWIIALTHSENRWDCQYIKTLSHYISVPQAIASSRTHQAMEKAPPRPLIIPQRDLESQRPLVLAPRSSAQATWATVIYSELDSVPIQASNAGSTSRLRKQQLSKCVRPSWIFLLLLAWEL